MMLALENEKAGLSKQVTQAKQSLEKVEAEHGRLLGQLTEQVKHQQTLEFNVRNKVSNLMGN